MRVSYSQWSLYHQCPFKWKCKYVLKLKEPAPTGAVSRGSDIHNMIEGYILKDSDMLPWDAGNSLNVPPMGSKHPLQPVVDMLRNWTTPDVHVEKPFYLDIDMAAFPAEGDEAYIVIFDAAAHKDGVVEVAEWKSGRPYAEHAEQRSLYATAALSIWAPKKVVVTTHYVDLTGDPASTVALSDALPDLKRVWQSRRESIINDTILAPRPNSKCKWCHFRKSNGGPCPLEM